MTPVAVIPMHTPGEAVCKALFMGGVTRRFPALKFAFLEGGVGWGRASSPTSAATGTCRT